MENIFERLPDFLPEELVEVLAENSELRIERIVSRGHRSPGGFWYDQTENEWVLVLRGEAKLRIEDRDELIWMKPGDFINIRAHQRHRVEWTAEDEPTIWLAVFYL